MYIYVVCPIGMSMASNCLCSPTILYGSCFYLCDVLYAEYVDGYGYVDDDKCVDIRCGVCLLFVGVFGGKFMDGVMGIV